MFNISLFFMSDSVGIVTNHVTNQEVASYMDCQQSGGFVENTLYTFDGFVPLTNSTDKGLPFRVLLMPLYI